MRTQIARASRRRRAGVRFRRQRPVRAGRRAARRRGSPRARSALGRAVGRGLPGGSIRPSLLRVRGPGSPPPQTGEQLLYPDRRGPKRTELAQQPGGVGVAPVLDDLAIDNVADRYATHGHVPAAIGAGGLPVRRDAVTLDDLVLHRDLEVREDGPVERHGLAHALEAAVLQIVDVIAEVRAVELPSLLEVAARADLLDRAAGDRLRVMFSGRHVTRQYAVLGGCAEWRRSLLLAPLDPDEQR